MSQRGASETHFNVKFAQSAIFKQIVCFKLNLTLALVLWLQDMSQHYSASKMFFNVPHALKMSY